MLSSSIVFFILIIVAIGFHIYADFHLQGCLADLKQKSWWEKNTTPQSFFFHYKNDYKMALLIHSIEWTLFTFVPVLILKLLLIKFVWNGNLINYISIYFPFWVFGLIVNTIVHYVVDDAKANQFVINLVEDQVFHFLQILGTVFAIWAMQ